MNSRNLLDGLQENTRKIILEANQWLHLPAEALQQKPADGGWTVAQVLEHLNIYSRFYITAIEKKLHFHETSPALYFKPGWLGDYFTKIMKPDAQQKISKKMKAPKNAIPSENADGKDMLREFIDQQQQLINLLQIAKSAHLGRLRIRSSLSSLITLKLGDAFRFFIAHQERHMLQIKRVLQETSVIREKSRPVFC